MGFNFECLLSNCFILIIQSLYTRRSVFKVSCVHVTNNTLSDSA